MYRLKSWLFGCDYVAWSNFSDQGVAKVHVSPDGQVYYWRYRNTKVIDRIGKPSDVVWLTCKANKYFPLEGMNV
jgi:hypothetical protein